MTLWNQAREQLPHWLRRLICLLELGIFTYICVSSCSRVCIYIQTHANVYIRGGRSYNTESGWRLKIDKPILIATATAATAAAGAGAARESLPQPRCLPRLSFFFPSRPRQKRGILSQNWKKNEGSPGKIHITELRLLTSTSSPTIKTSSRVANLCINQPSCNQWRRVEATHSSN